MRGLLGKHGNTVTGFLTSIFRELLLQVKFLLCNSVFITARNIIAWSVFGSHFYCLEGVNQSLSLAERRYLGAML